MLQKLRDQTQSLGFKVMVGIIVFVLAVFGFGAANLFVNRDPGIASAGGLDITQNMVVAESERERRRIAAQMGPDFDPNLIDPVRLQNVVVERLIGKALLNQALRDLNMGVSEASVNSVLIENSNFQIDGKFDEATYRRMVQLLGYTPQAFVDATRESLALDQLQTGITQTSFLPDWELKQMARLVGQRRDLAYLPFTLERFEDQAQVSAEDVQLRYEENRLVYMTEETADVGYVELALDDLLNDPSIKVTEEELLAAYEADKIAAAPEERRSSRHILLLVNDTRTAEAAQEQLLQLKARIDAGEPFADLAREFSDDPGSAPSGGNLGAMGRGVFDPDFEAALWQLEPGQVSDPVRTEFGYHLIKLDNVDVATYPEFAQLRGEIDTRLRRDQARVLYDERLRELDNLAFEQADSLDGIVDRLGLESHTVKGVSMTSGTDLFGNVKLREAVFAPEVISNGFNTAAVEYVDGRALVARVLQRHDPEPIPLETVAPSIREQIASERARVRIEEAQAAALARVQAGESVADVANEYGLSWRTFELTNRTVTDVPREVLQVAFDLQRPPAGGKVVGEAIAANGERYVVTVTRIQDGDVSTMSDGELTSVRNLLGNRVISTEFEAFYATLEQEGSVRRPN